MQADVVGQIAHVLQDLSIPFQVRRHFNAARTADDQLDGPVDVTHHLRRLLGADGVLVGGDVPQLPGAVHLVAQAPELHPMWIGAAVGDAPVGVLGSGWAIAVFHPVAGLLWRAGAQVDGEHRRPVHLSTELDVFVRAELVGLDALPGQFAHDGPLLAGANPVHPVVARGEVATRVAHGRHVQSSESFQYVGAEALGISVGAVRVIHTFIYGSPHMLQEPAEDARVHRADLKVRVQFYRCRFHGPWVLLFTN